MSRLEDRQVLLDRLVRQPLEGAEHVVDHLDTRGHPCLGLARGVRLQLGDRVTVRGVVGHRSHVAPELFFSHARDGTGRSPQGRGGSTPSIETVPPVWSRWAHPAAAAACHHADGEPSPSRRSRPSEVLARHPPTVQASWSRTGAWWGSNSEPRSRPTYVGRRSSGAATSSARPVTPVITSSDGSSRFRAPSMSVSRRSPTMRGRSPPTRRIVSSRSGGSGFPATTGSTLLKRVTISTSTPCPGASPPSSGKVRSVLLATHGRPSRILIAARMMSDHTRSGL